MGEEIKRKNQTYYRWCFLDVVTARTFVELFGGSLVHGDFSFLTSKGGTAIARSP